MAQLLEIRPAVAHTDPSAVVAQQYLTPDKLKDRAALHDRYGNDVEDFHAWQFRQVQGPADARVLELGCGSGRLWQVNAGRIPPGWELTLSDLSEGMLRETETSLTRAGVRALYRQHPATALPYDDASFDLMFANHMLYHVSDVALALREARRVLRPGGRLYAATNGESHMAEATALLDELIERLPELESQRPDISPFSLESGEERLRAAFADVRLFERPDQMLVTDAEPLLRYVLSLVDQPLEDLLGPAEGPATRRQRHARAQFDRWRRSVEDRLEAEALVVRRVSGFFEAL